MTCRLTREAEGDLFEIFLHGLEVFGLATAEAYRDKIRHSLAIIGDNPEIASLKAGLSPPVRVHPVGVHVIVYHLGDDGVPVILRVRSARENWVDAPVGDA